MVIHHSLICIDVKSFPRSAFVFMNADVGLLLKYHSPSLGCRFVDI